MNPVGSQSQPPSLWEAPPPGWEQTSFGASVPPYLVCASSTRIVWSGHRPGATGSEADLADCIYLYDLKEHREKLIWRASHQGGQVILAFLSGDWLVWVDYTDLLRGSDWIIYAWNLSTGERFPIAGSRAEERGALAPVPHIQGIKVVWDEKEQLSKDEQARSVIKVYDLLRRETTVLYAPENY